MRSIRRAGAVVFDCDSTLASIEGLEHLARDKRPEIERLTEAAMRGEVPLEQVYGRRLEIVRPRRTDVEALGQAYVDALVPDAAEVVAALHAEAIDVRILSGGLRPAVAFLAGELGIPDRAIAAVGVAFDENGEYAGFDTASPLARSGGKREVIRSWRGELPVPVMLVGDGATDLEAADDVEMFVAYAGVIDRSVVTAAADAVVRSHSLAPVLALALGGKPPAMRAHRATFDRGVELLDGAYRSRWFSD
jgi:phosphoserine phosphatase